MWNMSRSTARTSIPPSYSYVAWHAFLSWKSASVIFVDHIRGTFFSYQMASNSTRECPTRTILKSNNSEAIEDLAWASFTIDRSGLSWLKTLADHVINLDEGGTEHFPPSLRRPFIYCVEWVGLDALEDVGSQIFVKLLNRLRICVEDLEVLYRVDKWAAIILEIIRSAKGVQHLTIKS